MRPEVALYEPLIPQNTGNIGRLCVGFKTELSLIGKLGFSLKDKYLKRSGLDYWPHLKWRLYPDFSSFYREKTREGKVIYGFSKKASSSLHQHRMVSNSVLLFGKETTGLPDEVIKHPQVEMVRISILGAIRSFNLANATAMALYEVYRRNGLFES